MREQYPFDENSTVVMDFACGVGVYNPPYFLVYSTHTSILGLISRELAPYTKSIVGVDITQALVDSYNQRVANQGITPDEMRAVCTELKGKEGELNGLKFDVIVVSLLINRDYGRFHVDCVFAQCSASYHHFESIEDMTKILVFFLKPGAALLVVDIQDPSEAHPHGFATQSNTSNVHVIPQKFHHITPHTHGFKSDRIRKVFEDAGLTSFSFNKAMSATKKERTFSFDETESRSDSQEITFFIAKGEKKLSDL